MESILYTPRLWLARDSYGMKSIIESFTGGIPGKHSARSIGTLPTGCETQYENPGFWIPKAWHGTTPVVRMIDLDFCEIMNEAGTSLAGNDPLIEIF